MNIPLIRPFSFSHCVFELRSSNNHSKTQRKSFQRPSRCSLFDLIENFYSTLSCLCNYAEDIKPKQNEFYISSSFFLRSLSLSLVCVLVCLVLQKQSKRQPQNFVMFIIYFFFSFHFFALLFLWFISSYFFRALFIFDLEK